MSYLKEVDWRKWLAEPVVWNYIDSVPRHVAISRLCKALVTFVKSHGYLFRISEETLKSQIASGLYNNRDKSYLDSDWSFPSENDEYHLEHKNYYTHVMNIDAWSSFWMSWGVWSDLDDDIQYGFDRRLDIEQYVWRQLHLEKSIHTKTVNEILGLEEENVSENEIRDTFLQETN
jgi:hypothetical protein